MAKVSLHRATQLTGKARSTIHRAMRVGRVSYETDDHGVRHIDVSELERAFGLLPPSPPEGNGARTFERHDVELHDLRTQLEVAQVKVAMLEARTADLTGERDRLLGVLEQHAEQLKRLTFEHEVVPHPERPRRRWWRWALFIVV